MKITSVIAFIFMFLFTYTALSKLLTYASFYAVLQSSPLIGNYANVVAWAIPVIELSIVGLLVFPPTRSMGLKASSVLMIMFTAYLGYMLAFTPELPCSCGGVMRQLSWQQHLWFNLGLIVLALTGILSTNPKLFIAIIRRSRKPA